MRQFFQNGYVHRTLKAAGKLQSVLGLLMIVIAAVLLSPAGRQDGALIFLTSGNITDILRQMSEIGIMALAMTFVIVTAGIDLSVGSVLAFSATLIAKLLTSWNTGLPDGLFILLAAGIVLAASAAVGMLNGLFISRLRLQPFIVTLAVMIGIRGLARRITNNANIDIGFGEDVSAVFADFLSQKILVIGTFLVLTLIFGGLLSRTVFGRYVRALGDNRKASKYAGLPITKITVLVYMLSGLMAGLAGLIHCAQNHQGNPNDGISYELEAIAAVVIGGTSLAGGRGTVWGTVVGALIMGVLTNIFRLRGIDINVEMMVKAVIIILAVWVQQRKKQTE